MAKEVLSRTFTIFMRPNADRPFAKKSEFFWREYEPLKPQADFDEGAAFRNHPSLAMAIAGVKSIRKREPAAKGYEFSVFETIKTTELVWKS